MQNEGGVSGNQRKRHIVGNDQAWNIPQSCENDVASHNEHRVQDIRSGINLVLIADPENNGEETI